MNKHDHAATKKIPLVEKFGPTIQGEGATIGLQTYFLRFGLCDYQCTMCDSMHAVDPIQVKKNALWITQQQIADMFDPHEQPYTAGSKYPTKWITLSGGNPCIHDLTYLVDMLHNMDYKIAVETQGTFCPDWVTNCEIVTVSPKGPGMGEIFEPEKYTNFISKVYMNSRYDDNLNTKVVIFNDADIAFAEQVAQLWTSEGNEMSRFYLSQGNPFPPGKGAPVSSNLHVDILRDNYLKLFDQVKQSKILCEAKFLPQFHVWLWSNKQGV